MALGVEARSATVVRAFPAGAFAVVEGFSVEAISFRIQLVDEAGESFDLCLLGEVGGGEPGFVDPHFVGGEFPGLDLGRGVVALEGGVVVGGRGNFLFGPSSPAAHERGVAPARAFLAIPAMRSGRKPVQWLVSVTTTGAFR